MSRATLAHRPLSTTEELERLEQSITLTLQEIDRNFSKAHRIVTANILPVVEQYGENCRAVWEASKFWKQFFEAAANVSLSGYEEQGADDESTTAEETVTTVTQDDDDEEEETQQLQPDDSAAGEDTSMSTPQRATHDESVLTDVGSDDLSGSTPRPPTSRSSRPQFAKMHSPYEALRQELKRSGRSRAGDNDNDNNDDDSTAMLDESRGAGDEGAAGVVDSNDNDDGYDSSAADSALLAERTARLPDMSMTPRLSLDERHRRAAEDEQASRQREKDPLLHHILDKTYRIGATPHKTSKTVKARGLSPRRLKVTEGPRQPSPARERERERERKSAWHDSSPMSSPEMAVPQLRSAAFLSPMRTTSYRSKLAAATTGPRTPGVSVQTPATKAKTRDFALDEELGTDPPPNLDSVRRPGGLFGRKNKDEITWESSDEDGDDDLYGGMSPPKTISFALPPSKLLQTPAREASKRIVQDILLTAGEEINDNPSEYSPTMVKMNADILDDTF